MAVLRQGKWWLSVDQKRLANALSNAEGYAREKQKRAQQQSKKYHPQESISSLLIPVAFLLIIAAVAMILVEPELTGYTVKSVSDESAPRWIHDSRHFTIPANEEWVYDLDTLFYSSRELSYTATATDGIVARTNHNLLTLIPQKGFSGNALLTLFASDGENVARIHVKVNTEDNKGTTEPRAFNAMTGAVTAITGAAVRGACLVINVPGLTILDPANPPNCLDVQVANVFIECGGTTISGDGNPPRNGIGINFNVPAGTPVTATIQNCVIKDLDVGINAAIFGGSGLINNTFQNNRIGIAYQQNIGGLDVENSFFFRNDIGIRGSVSSVNGLIFMNNFSQNILYGLYLTNANNMNVSNNSFDNNGNGTFFDPSQNSFVEYNNYLLNGYGFFAESTQTFTVKGNIF